jgi:L-ectoine synthase
MIVRSKYNVEPVEWGNGQSYRLLVDNDSMGFTVAHTVVKAGSESRLQYTRHLEACYCIDGKGEVRSADGENVHVIEPGVIYALNEHDKHVLMASPDKDMHLISVFNPPLTGHERHSLSSDGFSHY